MLGGFLHRNKGLQTNTSLRVLVGVMLTTKILSQGLPMYSEDNCSYSKSRQLTVMFYLIFLFSFPSQPSFFSHYYFSVLLPDSLIWRQNYFYISVLRMLILSERPLTKFNHFSKGWHFIIYFTVFSEAFRVPCPISLWSKTRRAINSHEP